MHSAPVPGPRPGHGGLSVLFGLVTLVATTWIWAISATPFDPPTWSRILGSTLLPIGIAGTVGTAVPAWRAGDRSWTLAALGLLVASVVTFVVLVSLYE